MIRRLTIILAAAILTACQKPTPVKQEPTTPEKPAAEKVEPASPKSARMAEANQVANLIDPSKLATLKSRGANPRILKVVAILWTAKAAGKSPEEITQQAVEKIGWADTQKGDLTAAAILRNLDIAEKLGSTTPEDIVEMRKGQSPIVRLGSSAGDILSIDHIIPVAAAPELSNVIANLELLPLRLNQSKGDKIGQRQHDLSKKLHSAGLLKQPINMR